MEDKIKRLQDLFKQYQKEREAQQKTQNMASLIEAVFTLLSVWFILIPTAALYQGLVLSLLWAWFVAPPFGLPHLPVLTGAGLTLMFAVLMIGKKERKEGPSGKIVKTYVENIVLTSTILFIAWIMHLVLGW